MYRETSVALADSRDRADLLGVIIIIIIIIIIIFVYFHS